MVSKIEVVNSLARDQEFVQCTVKISKKFLFRPWFSIISPYLDNILPDNANMHYPTK